LDDVISDARTYFDADVVGVIGAGPGVLAPASAVVWPRWDELWSRARQR
jgi:hypothetical protein